MSTARQKVTGPLPLDDPRRADRLWRRPVDIELRDAYLLRLGWSAPPKPTVDTLIALHQAQTALVPYEVVWIALGEERTVEPLDSVRYVVAGRGGYCYHLNGAMACLLDWLGFDVHWRVGGVQGPQKAGPVGANSNHLTIEVHGLPSPASPDGVWLVDTGIGDALHGPLPLVAGKYRQHPMEFGLRPSDVVPGGWRFDHDKWARCPGMDYAPYEATVEDFLVEHENQSTSAESGFVRVVALCRRDGDSATVLRGLRLLHHSAEGDEQRDIGSAADYFTTLADVFHLPLSDVDDDRKAALYREVVAKHEEFLRQSTQ
ncbi:arylamine N-acetyltransferase family protein [Actinokineospora cianjurensis]|uniref:Arylamine N-acetyltransferase n=1 Tax=Actinokineospora cianjurensis TaxID=585224 RepID=A0A421B8M7_9PSEU|nr:arylamine N-acetyltransferase [Actinokineospora cianjurensis]RLK60679.1 arylamine N-acetyltransferase [Actinokineospora cianjurensis]